MRDEYLNYIGGRTLKKSVTGMGKTLTRVDLGFVLAQLKHNFCMVTYHHLA